MRNVLLFVPAEWEFGTPGIGHSGFSVQMMHMTPGWGLSRLRGRLRALRDGMALARRAAGYDVVVLSTVSAEVALFSRLIQLRRKRPRILVLDFLAPRREFPRWLAVRLFRPVDRFLVIRSGDAEMLERRFGVDTSRTAFVRWPVRVDRVPDEVSEEGYVYSAGWAHRDWPTLVTALDLSGLRAKLAPGVPLDIPDGSRERIEVLEMPPPKEGRELAARASVIAVVMVDTQLPSGPIVLLDALAAGKAVVATEVNGTRDYVRDRETALVVPPNEPRLLAEALTRLMADASLRESLGRRARHDVEERSSVAGFWERLLDECR